MEYFFIGGFLLIGIVVVAVLVFAFMPTAALESTLGHLGPKREGADSKPSDPSAPPTDDR